MRNRRAAVPSRLLASVTSSPTRRPSAAASWREIRIVGSWPVCAATFGIAHQAIDANATKARNNRTFELCRVFCPLPLRVVEQRLIFVREDSLFGIFASEHKSLLFL